MALTKKRKIFIAVGILLVLLIAAGLTVFIIFWHDGGRNVVITTDNVAVAAIGKDGGLVSQSFPNGDEIRHDFPQGVSSFDDVSLDSDNAELVFAVSVSDHRVCGYTINPTSAALSLINCVGSDFPVSPFCGLAAQGGNLIVSGGVGGVTYFRYDPDSGTLQKDPVFQARRGVDGVRGFPDVIMLSPTLIAFSTDFSTDPSGTGQFGTFVISLENNELSAVRKLRVNGGRFDNAEKPTNFAFVNARFAGDNGTYLYTANGVLGAADANADDPVTLVDSTVSKFEAVTVAVTPSGDRVFYGGLVDGDGRILEFDASEDPINLTFTQAFDFDQGRITSIAASDEVLVIATDGGKKIDFISIK